MGTLSSSTTDAELWAAYDNNVAYDVDASTTKAGIFIEACRMLLRRQPLRIDSGGHAIQFNSREIRSELQAAKQWLARRGSGAVRFASVEEFRT